MVDAELNNYSLGTLPSYDHEILLKELELDWQDYRSIRNQTWKSVIASGALLVGVFSAGDFFWGNECLLIIGLLGLLFLNLFGVCVSVHHKKCEREKLFFIQTVEKLLYISNSTSTLYKILKKAPHSRIGLSSGFFSINNFIICYHAVIVLFCSVLIMIEIIP
ncbi:MAG: hypothetical protein E7052_10735 [Lentisphaerae bacterium]|nr:hypothetical protein [Lentisphaerota bacterium]